MKHHINEDEASSFFNVKLVLPKFKHLDHGFIFNQEDYSSIYQVLLFSCNENFLSKTLFLFCLGLIIGVSDDDI